MLQWQEINSSFLKLSKFHFSQFEKCKLSNVCEIILTSILQFMFKNIHKQTEEDMKDYMYQNYVEFVDSRHYVHGFCAHI